MSLREKKHIHIKFHVRFLLIKNHSNLMGPFFLQIFALFFSPQTFLLLDLRHSSHENRVLGPVSRRSRKVFGPESRSKISNLMITVASVCFIHVFLK